MSENKNADAIRDNASKLNATVEAAEEVREKEQKEKYSDAARSAEKQFDYTKTSSEDDYTSPDVYRKAKEDLDAKSSDKEFDPVHDHSVAAGESKDKEEPEKKTEQPVNDSASGQDHADAERQRQEANRRLMKKEHDDAGKEKFQKEEEKKQAEEREAAENRQEAQYENSTHTLSAEENTEPDKAAENNAAGQRSQTDEYHHFDTEMQASSPEKDSRSGSQKGRPDVHEKNDQANPYKERQRADTEDVPGEDDSETYPGIDEESGEQKANGSDDIKSLQNDLRTQKEYRRFESGVKRKAQQGNSHERTASGSLQEKQGTDGSELGSSNSGNDHTGIRSDYSREEDASRGLQETGFETANTKSGNAHAESEYQHFTENKQNSSQQDNSRLDDNGFSSDKLKSHEPESVQRESADVLHNDAYASSHTAHFEEQSQDTKFRSDYGREGEASNGLREAGFTAAGTGAVNAGRNAEAGVNGNLTQAEKQNRYQHFAESVPDQAQQDIYQSDDGGIPTPSWKRAESHAAQREETEALHSDAYASSHTAHFEEQAQNTKFSSDYGHEGEAVSGSRYGAEGQHETGFHAGSDALNHGRNEAAETAEKTNQVRGQNYYTQHQAMEKQDAAQQAEYAQYEDSFRSPSNETSFPQEQNIPSSQTSQEGFLSQEQAGETGRRESSFYDPTKQHHGFYEDTQKGTADTAGEHYGRSEQFEYQAPSLHHSAEAGNGTGSSSVQVNDRGRYATHFEERNADVKYSSDYGKEGVFKQGSKARTENSVTSGKVRTGSQQQFYTQKQAERKAKLVSETEAENQRKYTVNQSSTGKNDAIASQNSLQDVSRSAQSQNQFLEHSLDQKQNPSAVSNSAAQKSKAVSSSSGNSAGSSASSVNQPNEPEITHETVPDDQQRYVNRQVYHREDPYARNTPQPHEQSQNYYRNKNKARSTKQNEQDHQQVQQYNSEWQRQPEEQAIQQSQEQSQSTMQMPSDTRAAGNRQVSYGDSVRDEKFQSSEAQTSQQNSYQRTPVSKARTESAQQTKYKVTDDTSAVLSSDNAEEMSAQESYQNQVRKSSQISLFKRSQKEWRSYGSGTNAGSGVNLENDSRDMTAIANNAIAEKQDEGFVLEDSAASTISDFLYGTQNTSDRDRLARLTQYADYHAANRRSGNMIRDFKNNQSAIENTLKQRYGLDTRHMSGDALAYAITSGTINGKTIPKGSDMEFLLKNLQQYKANEKLLQKKIKKKKRKQRLGDAAAIASKLKNSQTDEENIDPARDTLHIAKKTATKAAGAAVNGTKRLKYSLTARKNKKVSQEGGGELTRKYYVKGTEASSKVQVIDGKKQGKGLKKKLGNLPGASDAEKDQKRRLKIRDYLRRRRQEKNAKKKEKQLQDAARRYLRQKKKRKIRIILALILALILLMGSASSISLLVMSVQPDGVEDEAGDSTSSSVNRIYTDLMERLSAYEHNIKDPINGTSKTLTYGIPQSWINKIGALKPEYLVSEFNIDDPAPVPAIKDESGNIRAIDLKKYWGQPEDLTVTFNTYNPETEKSDIKNELILHNVYGGMVGDIGEIDCTGSPTRMDGDVRVYERTLTGDNPVWQEFKEQQNDNITIELYYNGARYDYKLSDVQSSKYYRTDGDEEGYNLDSILKAAVCMFYGMEDMDTPFDEGSSIEGFAELYINAVADHILDNADITMTETGMKSLEGDLTGVILKDDSGTVDIDHMSFAPYMTVTVNIDDCGLPDAMTLMDNDPEVGEAWLKENDPCGYMSQDDAVWTGWFVETNPANDYGMSDAGDTALELYELGAEEWADLMNDVPDAAPLGTPLTNEQIEDYLDQLEESGQLDDTNVGSGGGTRRDFLYTAMSLVGYFKYYWGGAAPNQDTCRASIGELQEATGRGLDCSGFVSTALGRSFVDKTYSRRDTSALYQTADYNKIDIDDLQPGDLILKNALGAGADDHVIIYAGRFDSHDGFGTRDQYIECTTWNGVGGTQLSVKSRADYIKRSRSSGRYVLAVNPFTHAAGSVEEPEYDVEELAGYTETTEIGEYTITRRVGNGVYSYFVLSGTGLVDPDVFHDLGRIMLNGNIYTYYDDVSGGNMSGVIALMRDLGYSEDEWQHSVDQNGYHRFGKYVMVAADLNYHPKGSIVNTPGGLGIVCDSGTAIVGANRFDIAVDYTNEHWD